MIARRRARHGKAHLPHGDKIVLQHLAHKRRRKAGEHFQRFQRLIETKHRRHRPHHPQRLAIAARQNAFRPQAAPAGLIFARMQGKQLPAHCRGIGKHHRLAAEQRGIIELIGERAAIRAIQRDIMRLQGV